MYQSLEYTVLTLAGVQSIYFCLAPNKILFQTKLNFIVTAQCYKPVLLVKGKGQSYFVNVFVSAAQSQSRTMSVWHSKVLLNFMFLIPTSSIHSLAQSFENAFSCMNVCNSLVVNTITMYVGCVGFTHGHPTHNEAELLIFV